MKTGEEKRGQQRGGAGRGQGKKEEKEEGEEGKTGKGGYCR
jgi:hypothetical protein